MFYQIIPLALSFIPGAVWLWFFLKEDADHPEPKGLILSTFIWGAVTTFYVLPLQVVAKRALIYFDLGELSFYSLIILSLIEELMKFVVVYLWISRRRDFDEPVDAMIYMITAALGFATLENIATAVRVDNSFELLTLRFIGANLLHSLASGIVGYYWAKGILKKQISRYVVIGILLATIIHSIFNMFMVNWGPGIRVSLFLIFIAIFVLNDFELLKRFCLTKPRLNRFR